MTYVAQGAGRFATVLPPHALLISSVDNCQRIRFGGKQVEGLVLIGEHWVVLPVNQIASRTCSLRGRVACGGRTNSKIGYGCKAKGTYAPVYSMLRAAFFITTVMLPVVRAAAPAMARTGCCECCSARGAFFAATRPRDEPASKVLLTT